MKNVPRGFKKTKIGVAPNDWKEFYLKDILELTIKPLKMEDNREYELITVRRRFGGIDSRGKFKGKDILVKTQFYIKEHDFVISKRQISHGACGLVPKELDGSIVSNEYNVFQTNKTLLDYRFFDYYVELPKFNRTFYIYSDGIHIEKLLFKTQSWLKQKIPIPSIKEQEKIVEILTTMDNLITKQEELIFAKERQFKGLLQRLLSGVIRFNGFTDKWNNVKLGKVSTVTTGNSNRQDSGLDGEFTFFDRSEDIRRSNRYLFDSEAVIVAGEGQAFIPKYFVGKFDLHQRTYAIIDFKNVVGKYIYYYILENRNYFLSQAVGSTVKSLRLPMFNNMSIKLPILEEQEKIAEVLTSAEKQISLLKYELEELRKQKKSLMQKLLTGKVRVKV